MCAASAETRFRRAGDGVHAPEPDEGAVLRRRDRSVLGERVLVGEPERLVVGRKAHRLDAFVRAVGAEGFRQGNRNGGRGAGDGEGSVLRDATVVFVGRVHLQVGQVPAGSSVGDGLKIAGFVHADEPRSRAEDGGRDGARTAIDADFGVVDPAAGILAERIGVGAADVEGFLREGERIARRVRMPGVARPRDAGEALGGGVGEGEFADENEGGQGRMLNAEC